jgi:hypothetical protein
MAEYDFNQLLKEAKAGAAWPVGDYDFEVADAVAKKTSNGDKEMVVAKLRCLVGPYANKTVTNNFVLSPDSPTALAIWFRQMNAFGLDDSFFAQIGSTSNLAPVAEALKSRRARITIGHRTWNGATQNDVQAVKPIDGPANTLPAGNVPPAPPAGTVPPPPPAAPATQATAPPPPPPQTTPPPPPAAPVDAPAPATPPAPPPTAPPTPPPTQAPAVADPAPDGYTQELWNSIPDAAKAAIRAAQGNGGAQPAAVPPPPPSPLPV